MRIQFQLLPSMASAMAVAAALTVVACATTDETLKTAGSASPAMAKPQTILPSKFQSKLLDEPPRRVLVAPQMLAISTVIRPTAEVRVGPGAHYDIADRVLARGTQVLVFDKIGVWRKVVVMATSQTGWIHGQAISEPELNQIPMLVDVRRLPTVLAVHDVNRVQSFPSHAPLKAEVPKGTMFRSLMYADNRTLVWLPETNSVMWMSRKDVQ